MACYATILRFGGESIEGLMPEAKHALLSNGKLTGYNSVLIMTLIKILKESSCPWLNKLNRSLT